MKFKRYANYKDSGAEWLGEIPEHWNVIRLKYAASINDETLSENTDPDFEFLYVDIGSVDSVKGIQEKDFMRFETSPSRARRIVSEGDVIVSTVRTYLRAIAPIDEVGGNLIVSTGFAVIRPKNILKSKFAAYALRAPYFVDCVVANSVGVSYPAINENAIGGLSIAIPSLEEQFAISHFLEQETEKIDALIEKKERLIELLHEKRSALITHTVTKGLDPNPPMKDSDVKWIGKIPAHWHLKRFKYVCILQRGYDLSTDKFVGETYPVWASNGIIGYHDEYNVEGPSIIVGRSGSVGEVNFVETNFWAHNTALYAREFFASYPKFIFYLLVTMDLKGLSAGSAVGTLNRNYIHDTTVALPPLHEQNVIVNYIDRGTAKIDRLIVKIKEAIDGLKEYRTALISEAVTGKIDVREEAA